MEIIKLNKPKTTKERLVNQLTQEIGGVASYWNKIPLEELKALHEAIENNNNAKLALAKLVQQLQETRQTNSNLNRRNFGLTQTAARHERVANQLIKVNALLEQQKNELLQKVQKMVSSLSDLEKSEIRLGIQAICNHINTWVR